MSRLDDAIEESSQNAESMTLEEVLSRMWLLCDPNRGISKKGSGYHPDDKIGVKYEADGENGVTKESVTELTGEPYWKWFKHRAKSSIDFLRAHGYELKKIGENNDS